jgi:hypothetical protein
LTLLAVIVDAEAILNCVMLALDASDGSSNVKMPHYLAVIRAARG